MSKPTSRGRPKAVAADFWQILHSPSTWRAYRSHLSMKTLILSIALALPILAQPEGDDLLPARWFENIPATDDSIQRTLVFKSTAGVLYTVETSNNLTDWNTEETFYGLGHDVLVPMYEYTPPPPPPPGTPPRNSRLAPFSPPSPSDAKPHPAPEPSSPGAPSMGALPSSPALKQPSIPIEKTKSSTPIRQMATTSSSSATTKPQSPRPHHCPPSPPPIKHSLITLQPISRL